MFEILENLNVLHSQISPEKDNSKVTIFKVNLSKNVLFKMINLILKFYNDYLVQSRFLYAYLNKGIYLLNYFIFRALFEISARIKCSIISLKSKLSRNSYKTLVFRYFIIRDRISCSILYIIRKRS